MWFSGIVSFWRVSPGVFYGLHQGGLWLLLLPPGLPQLIESPRLIVGRISNFGKFSVKEKNERIDRNSAIRDAMMLAPGKIVMFKCSGKVRDKIKGK